MGNETGVLVDSEFRKDLFHDGVSEIMSQVEINWEYDIPYLAGYNKEGTKIYFHRNFPKEYCQQDGRKVEPYRYILLHEILETLLQQKYKLVYQLSHQIALYAERAAVEADGVDWYQYNRWVKGWIKKISEQPILKVPKDIDFQPYEDWNETALIAKMKAVQEGNDKPTVSTENKKVDLGSKPSSFGW